MKLNSKTAITFKNVMTFNNTWHELLKRTFSNKTKLKYAVQGNTLQ